MSNDPHGIIAREFMNCDVPGSIAGHKVRSSRDVH